LAREGQLDPVIGRKNEIERVIQILPTSEEQPVLLAKPALARRHRRRLGADGHLQQRAEILHDRRIVVLDLA